MFFYSHCPIFYVFNMCPMKFKTNLEKYQEELKKIAFPRLTGTEGELHAQSFLLHYIKSHNLPIYIDKFEFNDSHDMILRIRALLFSILLVFNLILQFFINSVYFLGVTCIIWMLFHLYPLILEAFLQKKPKGEKKESRNISTHINSKKSGEYGMRMSLILLIAHYDSAEKPFSDKISLVFEKILSLNMHLILILTIMSKLHFIYPTTTINIREIFIILSLATLLEIGGLWILMQNKLTNKSLGIEKNAAGMVSLQSLFEEILDNRNALQWLDITFLFSGAEEQGLFGKKDYFIKHRKELQTYRDLYIIDIKRVGDTLIYGYNIPLKKNSKSNDEVKNVFLHHFAKMKTPIKKTSKKFLEYDLVQHFDNSNIHYLVLTSPHTKNYAHSQEDFSTCNYQAISDIKEFIYNTILSLDRRIEEKIEAAE